MSRPRLITTQVCAALNEAGARYLVIGDIACILHGHIRPITDVDILIDPTPHNAARVLAGLVQVGYAFAGGWLPEALLAKPVTIVGDDPGIDIFTVAWSVRYADAARRAATIEVDGVNVPVIGLDDLIVSKRTGQSQDAADVLVLREIRQLRP